MLELRDVWLLDVYTAVVEHGSMAAAARSRHLTTPTVSEAISKLETLVGTTLLIRTPTGCHPTAEGRRILAPARALLAETNRNLQSINGRALLTYRIGSTFGAHTPVVVLANSVSEEIELSPVSLDLVDPGRSIIEGEVDMALLMGPTRFDEVLHREPLLEEPRIAVIGAVNVPPGASELGLTLLDRFQWPSVPPDADEIFLGPWLCNDIRPGPPPRQGQALGDLFAIRDWFLTNQDQLVLATTDGMARAFANAPGLAALPIADVPGWSVDLVGPARLKDQVVQIARLMRTAIPSVRPA